MRARGTTEKEAIDAIEKPRSEEHSFPTRRSSDLITNSQETLLGVISAFAFSGLRHPENHVRELFCFLDIQYDVSQSGF